MRLGIDPGVTGAMALIDDSNMEIINCWDMPIITVQEIIDTKLKDRRFVDIKTMLSILREIKFDYDPLVVIEYQQPMVDSAMTAFSMGGSYTSVLNAVYMAGFTKDRIILDKPSHGWKKRAGLIGKPKARSLAMCHHLFDCKDFLNRKKDHNRAEATLIAKFGE